MCKQKTAYESLGGDWSSYVGDYDIGAVNGGVWCSLGWCRAWCREGCGGVRCGVVWCMVPCMVWCGVVWGGVVHGAVHGVVWCVVGRGQA